MSESLLVMVRGNWTWLVMWWWWLPSLVTTQETPSSTPSLLPHMPGRMGEVPLVTLDDLDTYMDSLTELARLHISKAFTEESRLYRRSLDMKSVKVIGTQLAQFDLEGSVGDGSSWMNQVTGLHLLTRQHTSYWILGGPRNEYQRVVAWSAVDQTMRVIARFQLTSTSIVMVNRIAVSDGDEGREDFV
ncbi:uncharacterized protein LOC121872392 [Homarus americanus]|uniref:uncharacterized protein LOC121872392 n=1 Tax=Homarus americanus TaxID=6706 RepID=UPI001C47DB88|nr:uncharacterized protein LOC121872392 [Homarus americanus]